jgi:glutathione S-transferase
MSGITLYGPAEAPFTVKVERALQLKGVEYLLVAPESPEDYRRWNPETGLLPLLDRDGERVHDSTRILEWLDERYPNPPLLSSDPKLAEAQRRLEEWCDETFFFYWLRWQRVREAEESRPPRRFGLFAWARELAQGQGPSRPRRRDGLSVEVGELVDQLARRCDDLVNMLAGRDFFYGDRPSMADLAVYAMLDSTRRGTYPRGPEIVAARPELVALMDRVEKASEGA